MSTGHLLVDTVNGRPHVGQADRHVMFSAEMVDVLRNSPTEWQWADQDSLSIRDDTGTYTYRLVPHSPEVYAGELVNWPGARGTASGSATLADFLLARIAEDEERAQTGAPYMTWETADEDDYSFSGSNSDAWHSAACGYGMLEMGGSCTCGVPARVLAECEAKRRIVKECGWVTVMHFLALPYAGHTDYREEWRP